MYNISGKIKTKQILLILIFPAVVVALCIGYYVLLPWIFRIGSVGITAIRTHRLISRYIQENNGKFPPSEDDLISQKYIKKGRVRTGYEYYLNLNPSEPGERYYKYFWFKSLKIAYGTKIEEIELVDGKLYEKSTNKQILLIDGPYRKQLKKSHYEPLSVKWYEQMLKEKSE